MPLALATRPLLACALALLVSGLGLTCSSIQAAEAVENKALVAFPAELVLSEAGQPQGVLISQRQPDGSLRDVTAQVRWQSGNVQLFTISEHGQCLPVSAGATTLKAELDALSVEIPVKVSAVVPTSVPSFYHDVLPLLTRNGCNQGACHGKGVGQNGFRLSLRGYAPEWDYDWLVREYNGRRVLANQPEQSLLVRKATGGLPHGGGKLIEPDSRAAQTLVTWLGGGMPGPQKDEPTLTKLQLFPGNQTLRAGQTQPLLVLAEYSDGRRRDVTWLSKFFSNDTTVLDVAPDGNVRAVRAGETSIRAHFLGEVALVQFTIPGDADLAAERFNHDQNVLDGPVFRKLKELRIPPAELSSDHEFLRRMYLDTLGTLPRPDEVRAFLADTAPNKRQLWIDQALERPEFVDYWTLFLNDLLQNRKERDHDVRGTKGVRGFHRWLRQQVAANRPWNEIARDVLTVQGTTTDAPHVGYYVVTVGEQRNPEKSEVVDSVAQAFLGTRIGCAKCHNHPLERYTQDDYYHFAGFFSRVQFDRKSPNEGETLLRIGLQNAKDNERPVGVSQPRTHQFLPPRPLDRSEMTITPGEDPRVKLADWITNPNNEAFSGAMINRLWRHFLGVGLVEPVDDLRASNPPTNPELWQILKTEFVAHGYNLKHVMRLILNSRTYQLSSKTEPGNATDTRYYSHYYVRRLPAEVLLDALSTSTGVPDRFPGYPLGVRAIQIPDSGIESYFLSTFGRPSRVTACACERNGEVTISQLLHLQNSENVLQKIEHADGRLKGLLADVPAEARLDEVFLATLSRLPTQTERAQIQAQLPTDKDEQREAWRDLVWALLNTKEYLFNH